MKTYDECIDSLQWVKCSTECRCRADVFTNFTVIVVKINTEFPASSLTFPYLSYNSFWIRIRWEMNARFTLLFAWKYDVKFYWLYAIVCVVCRIERLVFCNIELFFILTPMTSHFRKRLHTTLLTKSVINRAQRMNIPGLLQRELTRCGLYFVFVFIFWWSHSKEKCSHTQKNSWYNFTRQPIKWTNKVKHFCVLQPIYYLWQRGWKLYDSKEEEAKKK